MQGCCFHRRVGFVSLLFDDGLPHTQSTLASAANAAFRLVGAIEFLCRASYQNLQSSDGFGVNDLGTL